MTLDVQVEGRMLSDHSAAYQVENLPEDQRGWCVGGGFGLSMRLN